MERVYNANGYKMDGSNYGVIFEGLRLIRTVSLSTTPSQKRCLRPIHLQSRAAPCHRPRRMEKYDDGTTVYDVYEKDGKKYIKKDYQGTDKYFEYDNGTVADNPADPQPEDPQLSKLDQSHYVRSGRVPET